MGKDADSGISPFGSMGTGECTLPLSSPYKDDQINSFVEQDVRFKAGGWRKR